VLDDKDRRILAQLREDAQQTTKAIAEATGIPRTTVHDRISRLEERGVIRQYTIVPDYEALGESTTAFIFLSYDARASVSQEEVAGELADIDAVYEVHMISGDWDLLAKVRGESIEQIGDLVIERVRGVGGVGKTQTSTVFRTWKEEV
jgi:DNA-binding Lrp family transcriptional regulator